MTVKVCNSICINDRLVSASSLGSFRLFPVIGGLDLTHFCAIVVALIFILFCLVHAPM